MLVLHNRDRQHRTCPCCLLDALGDMRHLLLECPDMQPVLQRLAYLFAEADTMQIFVWRMDMVLVACYI